MNPAVRVEGVGYRNGGSLLLDGVSLVADPGDVIGIVGPNGAGKSTLLRVLAGDLAPSTGRAWIHDVEPARTPLQRLAELRAYLSPPTSTTNPFTVRDTVAMGRHPHRRAMLGAAEHEAIVDAAMQQTDVAHLAGRAVNSLSTGEHQAVGLARAIAQEAPVLLLDEPTSALDIGHQEKVMILLRSLAAAGTTVVAVLHDLNLAAAHTDRLLLLDAGRAVALGKPTEVLTSDGLSSVYRQPIEVVAHPHRDCPLVLTVDG